ncbi:MAG: hypothetical protein CMP96_03375 [Gammaproteobacteria bacterium]|nr:hypothetical protein [Gammaproteobacteria bacterium]
MEFSIKHRLFYRIWFTSMLLILVSAVSFYVYSVRELDEATKQTAMEKLEAQLHLAEYFAIDVLAQNTVRATPPEFGSAEVRITVIDPLGQVLFDNFYDATRMENHLTRPEFLQAAEVGQALSTRYSVSLGQDFLYLAKRVDHQLVSRGLVRVATPMTPLREEVSAIRQQLVLTLLITTCLLTFISYFLTRRVYGPIENAALFARQVALGHYDARLPGVGEDEAAVLERALNSLARNTQERLANLEISRNQLAHILSALNEGVIAVDHNQRILHINRVAQSMLTADDSCIGQPIWHIAQASKLVESLLDSEGPQDREHTVQVGVQLLSISVLNLQTERSADLGAIIVLRDKSAEQRLEKIKVDFVANASHELKTPLTVIKAVTETLNDDPEMPKEDRHRFLTRIMEQAERLTAIVQDLFKLSRFDAFATDQPKFEIITLNKIVARAVDDRASSAEERRVAIVFNPQSVEKVRGDEEALRQLIVNLLDNALQYGPEGTSISVELESDSTDIYLSVSDQGPGIAAVHQSRVFERFYRVDGARARRDGGTGLGLSIVKNIATSHGGSVSLKSDVGQGSTFTLRLAKVVETSD